MVETRDVPQLIQEAEAVYDQLIDDPDSTLGSYWHSLFSASPTAKQFKDPEMYFISMYVQSEKDPAFPQKYPQEAKVMASVKEQEQAQPMPEPGMESGFDPVAYTKQLLGEENGNVGRPTQPTN
jgi:hypothetical protein